MLYIQNQVEDVSQSGNGRLLILIPAFNESANIEHVVDNICRNYSQYDYVVINDGSTDETRKICAHRGYNLLDLPVNVGLAGAIKAGMRYANYYGYDYVLQLDGDNQHDPKYIETMVRTLKEGPYDIVIGSRFVNTPKPKSMRMFGSSVIEWAIRVTTGKDIRDVTSGMRLFNKRMIKQFGYDIHYSPEPDTLAYLLNCGVKIGEVQVEMRDREGGSSYLNALNSAWYMAKMLFSIFVFQWVRRRRKELIMTSGNE